MVVNTGIVHLLQRLVAEWFAILLYTVYLLQLNGCQYHLKTSGTNSTHRETLQLYFYPSHIVLICNKTAYHEKVC